MLIKGLGVGVLLGVAALGAGVRGAATARRGKAETVVCFGFDKGLRMSE